MTEVTLKGISKRYGNKIVLKDINIRIGRGEFFVILGPSGAGKTTLLRIIAGLERQDSGHVLFDDKVVDDLEPYEREVAMVFQIPVLYPHLKVYDNIAFPITKGREKLSKKEVKEKVLWIAKLLKIENLLDRYPNQLSGGEKQRVMLAKALVRKPRVFLLDEPLVNLDAPLRLELRVEIARIQKKLGITTIFVTHDQAEALSLGDRIGVLMDGRLLQVGTPEEIYFMPNNLKVAKFIGNPGMNIVKGSVKNGSLILFNKEVLDLNYENKDVLIGFRPEDVNLFEGEFEGIVLLREFRGDHTVFYVDINDSIIAIKSYSKTRINVGDTIVFDVPKEKIYVFDKNSGERIWPSFK